MQVDKISLLDETIEYMKELERRVQELEARSARRSNDTAEQTSDNCGTSKFNDIRGSLPNKRKACDMDEIEPESSNGLLKCSSADSIVINMIDKEVSIKMSCLWSESLLLKIMEALTDLHMDCHTVQSSNLDGILSIAIESKVCQRRALFNGHNQFKKFGATYEILRPSQFICHCLTWHKVKESRKTFEICGLKYFLTICDYKFSLRVKKEF